MLQDKGHVQALEGDSLDLEEVNRKDRTGLGLQERAPGRTVVRVGEGGMP